MEEWALPRESVHYGQSGECRRAARRWGFYEHSEAEDRDHHSHYRDWIVSILTKPLFVLEFQSFTLTFTRRISSRSTSSLSTRWWTSRFSTTITFSSKPAASTPTKSNLISMTGCALTSWGSMSSRTSFPLQSLCSRRAPPSPSSTNCWVKRNFPKCSKRTFSWSVWWSWATPLTGWPSRPKSWKTSSSQIELCIRTSILSKWVSRRGSATAAWSTFLMLARRSLVLTLSMRISHVSTSIARIVL